MKYQNKEEFLNKVSKMIDNCINNGGTKFDIDI
jgi:hypothetical protein